MFAVDFAQMEWEEGLPGARAKTFRRQGRQLRLAEFTREFVEPDWCRKGHQGLVLQGELEVDFQGTLVRYPEGTAIFIAPDEGGGHKARAVTPVARLFLVEDA